MAAVIFKERRNAGMPYQNWNEFPPEAIVLVKNAYGESKIDLVKNLWWGYSKDLGEVSEGVIVKALRLDKPKRLNQ